LGGTGLQTGVSFALCANDNCQGAQIDHFAIDPAPGKQLPFPTLPQKNVADGPTPARLKSNRFVRNMKSDASARANPVTQNALLDSAKKIF
jgi:hypothetical protein